MMALIFLWAIASTAVYLIIVGLTTVLNAIFNSIWRNEW